MSRLDCNLQSDNYATWPEVDDVSTHYIETSPLLRQVGEGFNDRESRPN